MYSSVVFMFKLRSDHLSINENYDDNDGEYHIILPVTECEQLAQSGYVKAYQPGVDLQPIDRQSEALIITPQRHTL